MDLLQHGVDRSVIALWLGHESIETTQVYLHANLELKQKALATTEPYHGRSGRYRPDDKLLTTRMDWPTKLALTLLNCARKALKHTASGFLPNAAPITSRNGARKTKAAARRAFGQADRSLSRKVFHWSACACKQFCGGRNLAWWLPKHS